VRSLNARIHSYLRLNIQPNQLVFEHGLNYLGIQKMNSRIIAFKRAVNLLAAISRLFLNFRYNSF